MIALPLFGEDSSTSKSSFLLSLIATVVFWLIFLILAIFIQPSEKKTEEKFKTVQIVLSDIPQKKIDTENSIVKPDELSSESGAVETVESVEVPVETEAVVESPAPQVTETVPVQKVEPVKTVETPKTETPKVETKKTEPVKTETAKVETPKQTTTPVTETKTESVTPAATTTTTKPAQKKPFSWDDFDDDEPLTTTTTPKKVATTKNEVSGSSGTTNTNKTSQTTTSSSTSNKTSNTQTSGNTSNALSNIENAKGTTDTGTSNTPASNTPKSISTNSSGINLNFTGGGVRKATSALSITLSDESKKYIENTVAIPITITIEPDGTIIRSNIRFSSSIVHATVRNNIIAQISKWTFGPSEEQTTATFTFNIVVK